MEKKIHIPYSHNHAEHGPDQATHQARMHAMTIGKEWKKSRQWCEMFMVPNIPAMQRATSG
jgi:hypothetical protein